MATREIVLSTDSFIRKTSKPVKDFDKSLHELLDDMRDTLFENEGAGLAAVQVGVLKRVFITYANESLIEFINPEIIKKIGKQVNKEGCLSVKQPWGMVERPKQLTVKAYDRYGQQFTLTCKGYMAVAVSHENDHLDGVLYIDKIIEEKK